MLGIEDIDKKIEAYGLWCYRRLLSISWTDKKTNEWILNKIGVSERLLTNRRKKAFIGHKFRRMDITNDLLLGMVYGKRGRGRPKARYSDNIREISGGRSMTQMYRMAQDREKWRAMVVYFEPPAR